MKKLFMNPFAGVCKKGHSWGKVLMVALAALTMGACSDENEESIPVEFPAQQELTCNVNETVDFTFTASADWQLTSSALWCKFLVNDTEEFSTSGAAGEQTVKIKANDEDFGHEKSVANLTLTMGMRKQIVAQVVRSAKGYELSLLNEAGEKIDAIEVGYKEFKEFKVSANFHFAATNRPGWVDLDGGSLVGKAGETVVGKVKVIQNGTVEKYPVAIQDNETITFADVDGNASFTFPLIFKGMDPKEIEVEGVTNNVWGWTVSLDGKTFSQGGGEGTASETTTTEYKSRLPFTIKALNDDYEIVYLEKKEQIPGSGVYVFMINDEDETYAVDWMNFDKETMTLSVNPSSVEERDGYVLAFPRALYDEIKDDLWSNLIETTADPESGSQIQDLKYEYVENNLLINLVQKEKKAEVPSDAVTVKVTYFDETGMPVQAPLKKNEDEGLRMDYGNIEDIYFVDKTLSSSFNIDPMLGGVMNYYAGIGMMDVTSKCEQNENELNVWFSDEEGGIVLPDGQRLEIAFKDESGVTKKVVIFE